MTSRLHATAPAVLTPAPAPCPSLCPFGAFDAEGVIALWPSIESLAATSAPRVVLDLSGVVSMDGSGLGAITYMFKRLVARGRRLVVTGASGQPLEMLTALGLTHILCLEAPTPLRRRAWFGRWSLVRSH